MTVKLKKILIAILTATVLLCAGFLLLKNTPSATASADTSGDALEETRVHYNDDFRFANPITVVDDESICAVFPLAMDSNWIKSISLNYNQNAWNSNPIGQARFDISLYLKRDAQNAVKVKTYTILCYANRVHFFVAENSNLSVAELKFDFRAFTPKKYSYEGQGSLFNFMKNGLSENEVYSQSVSSFANIFDHYFLNNQYGLSESNYMFLYLKNASPDKTYYVDLSYEIWQDSWYNLFGTECNGRSGRDIPPVRAHISSKDMNLISSLTAEYQNNNNSFPRNAEYQYYAENLLMGYFEPTTVKIRYLKNIENTPFARAVEEEIQLPGLFRSEPTIDDFLSATGRDSMILNQASIYNFEYDDDGNIYIARYRDSIFLSAKTSDGYSQNYFLDINKSFDEYYNGFVQNEVFSVSLYRFFYNQIVLKFPVIETVAEKDLYGFFGFVVIPSGSQINETWKMMFNKPTTYSGQINYFMYNEGLTPGAYATLLGDFKYNWLQSAWQTLTNTVGGVVGLPGTTDANFYLFYVDSFEDSILWIGENSAENANDNNSSVGGDVSEVTEEVGGFISKAWSGISSALGLTGTILSNGWVVLLIVLGGVAIFIFFKFFFKKGSKGRRGRR